MLKYLPLSLLFVVVAGFAAEPKPRSKLAATEVVEQFADGCFMAFPYPEKFAEWIKQRGHKRLSGEAAARFVVNGSEEVWAARTPNSEFTLVSLGQSACTVFANDVDEETTRGMLTGFVQFLATQGATFSTSKITPVLAPPGSSSLNFAISMGGTVIAHITLTVAKSEHGVDQVAITAAKG